MSRIRAALAATTRTVATGVTRLRRAERAATMPEYALLVAVFVLPVYMGVSYLQSGAKTKIGQVAGHVASPRSTTTTADDGGGGGGGATSTTTTSTTTTSTTTTTAAPTTTTTQKPTTTTTTAAPTTTTTVPRASNDAPDLTAAKTNGSKWQVTGSVTVKDASGRAIRNATVTVKVESWNGSKWVDEGTTSDTTNNSGVFGFSVTGLSKNSDLKVRVTITSIDANGFDWDGKNATSTVDSPF